MSVTTFTPEIAVGRVTAKARPAHRVAAYSTARMHPGVFKWAIGIYGGMMLGIWLLFGTNLETGISLMICTVYGAMYFGVPVVMARIAAKAAPLVEEGSLGRFLRGDFETADGSLSGWSALILVVLIPAAIGFGLIAMGIILKLSA